jgi:hypothetical protein
MSLEGEGDGVWEWVQGAGRHKVERIFFVSCFQITIPSLLLDPMT